MAPIIVKVLTGKKILIEIDSGETLGDLKQKIFDKEGIHPDQQTELIFGGTRLEDGDDVSLLECIRSIQANIQSRSESSTSLTETTTPPVIHLVIRLTGGGNMIYHRPVRHDDDDDEEEEEVPPRRKLIRSSASSRPLHTSQYHHVPFRVSKIKRTSQSSYGASDDDDGHDKSSSPRRSSSRDELDRTRRRSSLPDDETSSILGKSPPPSETARIRRKSYSPDGSVRIRRNKSYSESGDHDDDRHEQNHDQEKIWHGSSDQTPNSEDHKLSRNGELRKPLKSSGARLQITIKHLKGYEICVEIEPLDTVDDLKRKIFIKEGISPDDQRLVFKGLEVHEGVVYDRVNAILARLNGSTPMSWALPDTETIHVTIYVVLRLRGGGNGIYHEVQFNRSSSSEHDSDRENPKDGTSSRQLALVQDPPQTPFSRDRLRRFGFGSKTTAHPALIGSSRTTNKGYESEENTGSDFGEVKYCVQGRESQVLFGISDLAREKIQQKETKSLHCEGIDQIIQGLYSLDLFRSRAVVDGEKRTEELMDQILELNKKISEMEGELANQKEVAKDAEDRSFNRGYERACRDIEECIAIEHPEWDLSFIQS